MIFVAAATLLVARHRTTDPGPQEKTHRPTVGLMPQSRVIWFRSFAFTTYSPSFALVAAAKKLPSEYLPFHKLHH